MRQSFLLRTLHALVAVTFLSAVVMAVDGVRPGAAVAEGFGTIHGTVLGSDGLPSVDAFIEVSSAEGLAMYASTGGDGTYTVSGLPVGSYRIAIWPAWYALPVDAIWRSPELVDVAEGASVQYDVRLPLGATVSGIITGNGEPLAAIEVILHDTTGGAWSTSTDGTGRYEVSAVPPGAFTVEVRQQDLLPGVGWQGEWFDDATAGSATVIDVTEGASVAMPGIDLLPLATISGRVTDWQGAPVPSMDVYAAAVPWPESGRYFHGVTDEDGRYVIGVSRGEYFVYFWADHGLGEFYDDVYTQGEAVVFDVLADEAFVADAQLRQPTIISGTITSHGEVAPWVNVSLVDADGAVVGSGQANESGEYQVFVPTPAVYTLCVIGDWRYIDECWNDQPAGTPGTPIDMTTALVFEANMDLGRAPTVSGRVIDTAGEPVVGMPVHVTNADGFWNMGYTDEEGRYEVMGAVGTVDVSVPVGWFWHEPVQVQLAGDEPLTGVDITLYRYAVLTGHSNTDPGAWEGHRLHIVGPGTDRYDWTDWQGDFTLFLAPGTYTVTVEPSDASWYMPASQQVTVDWGDTPTLDYALDPGGRISGEVLSDRAADVGDVRVDVISPATLEVVASTTLSGTTYVTPRLAVGSYYVQFRPADDNRHAAEYWDDSPTLGGATMVTVRPLEATIADARLHLRGAAAPYTPLDEKRSVELAWASFEQRNPVDTCWHTTLDVRVVEATTVTPKAKPATTRYADLTLVAVNDCWSITSTSRSTVSLAGYDAAVDPFNGAHLAGATIAIDGAVYFTDFVVDLSWDAEGDVVTVVSHNGEQTPGGAPGTHQVERRDGALVDGSVTSSPWAVVTFTTADLVDAGLATYTEVITR